MPRLSEAQWQSLASALARETARAAPDWTAQNAHDPGITVLEVLAYALTDLQYRAGTLDAQGRRIAQRVAGLAQTLAGATTTTGDGGCPPGLQRVNYFNGQMLGADDFTAEQNYCRQKSQRRNRLLYGAGIVSGLAVTLERAPGGAQVVIAPGLAFNARGDEIEVTAPTTLPLPAQGKSLLVLLRYAEQPCRPVPALASETPQETPTYSRIVETFSAKLAASPDDDAVALALLNFARGRWALDRKFRPARVRP